MALANCRDCGLEVSDAAVSCPRCGRVFQRQRQGLFLSTLNVGCLILFLLIGAAVVSVIVQYERDRPASGFDADLQRAAQPTRR